MNLPRIELHQKNMQIDWNVQPPSYLFQPAQTTLSIEQQPAEMVLHSTSIKLTIDQSRCWADMDIKPIGKRIAEEAADGKQSVLNYIARVANEGQQLGAIEKQGSVIKSMASASNASHHYQFQYGNIPGNFSLHIDCQLGELNMDWKTGGIHIGIQYEPYHQQYEKGKLAYYTKQKNQLQIQVVGGQVNTGY